MLTKPFLGVIVYEHLREWRNRQTRTFEGRVVIPYGFKSRLSHQIKNLHFSVGSLFLCQKTGRDLNPLAEGEHNRCRSDGKAQRRRQVPSLAPKKELRNSEALFLSNTKDWYVITLQRVCNRRRRMASPQCMQSFALITYATKVAVTFRLKTDYIHGSRRDFLFSVPFIVLQLADILTCFYIVIKYFCEVIICL